MFEDLFKMQSLPDEDGNDEDGKSFCMCLAPIAVCFMGNGKISLLLCIPDLPQPPPPPQDL